jgi:hypothetical protein
MNHKPLNTRLTASACLLLVTALVHTGAASNSAGKEKSVPQSVREFVATAYPFFEIVEVAAGDLDGDGVDEHVLLLNVDEKSRQRILIVGAKSSGHLELVSITKPIFHCHHGREIWIQKKSLYVHCFHSVDRSMSSNWTHQFAARDGRIRLIGSESWWAATSDDPANPEYSTSTNHLTGNVIESKIVKGRVVFQKKSLLPAIERKPQFLDEMHIQ